MSDFEETETPETQQNLETNESVGENSSATSYFVRKKTRITAEPIDNYTEDIYSGTSTVHDSEYTAPGSLLASSSYRKSRAGRNQLRRDLHYGQYLEVPKGRRDIFASKERKMHVKTFFALVIILAILFFAAMITWTYMQANWGSTY